MSLTSGAVRLSPGEDQKEFRDVVVRFLDERCGEAEVRRLMVDERGYDPAVWAQASEQLGLAGLDVPEKYGGGGATFREMAVVLEALGSSLACLPFFSTAVLAAGTLLLGDDEDARAEHLPGIVAGRTVATVAHGEQNGSAASDIHTFAERDGDHYVLSGSKCFVVDGHTADLLLVVAQTSAGLSLYAVDGNAPGLTRATMKALDPTRKLARLELENVPGRLVGTDGSAPAVLERVRDRAALAIACEQLGTAARALTMAVDYAKGRVQFGRAIGSFQAVKHRCVDIAQQVEAARSAVAWGTASAAEGGELAGVATAMATVCSTDAAVFATAENVQIHGGIGFTWEHPAHLYFRRARSSALLHGSANDARELMLQRLEV